jgi:hypothetical protein
VQEGFWVERSFSAQVCKAHEGDENPGPDFGRSLGREVHCERDGPWAELVVGPDFV